MFPCRFCGLVSATTISAALLAIGCQKVGKLDDTDDVTLNLTFAENPPTIGPASAIVELTGKGGKPVAGAILKLEGNMHHAGMKPSFANAQEVGPGKYVGVLEFTMGGDWIVLIDGTLADGRKLTRKVRVPGVKSGRR